MLLRKRLIDKLVLECEDETLNTTETLLNDTKVACAKSNCLIHAVSLIITCLLVSCYFFQPNEKHLLPFKDTIIKLREIRY